MPVPDLKALEVLLAVAGAPARPPLRSLLAEDLPGKSLEGDQAVLVYRLVQIEKQKATLEDEMRKLKGDNAFLKEETRTRKARQRKLEGEKAVHLVRIAKLEEQNATLERDTQKLEAEKAALQDDTCKLLKEKIKLEGEKAVFLLQERQRAPPMPGGEKAPSTEEEKARVLVKEKRTLENKKWKLEGEKAVQAYHIAELEQQKTTLEGDYDTLEAERAAQVRRVNEVEQEKAELETRAAELETKAAKLEYEKAEQKLRIVELEQAWKHTTLFGGGVTPPTTSRPRLTSPSRVAAPLPPCDDVTRVSTPSLDSKQRQAKPYNFRPGDTRKDSTKPHSLYATAKEGSDTPSLYSTVGHKAAG